MKKILIINRLGIGDVVLTTPLAKLLKEHKVNISQVAYAVGFTNEAHFSTVFRKHFGIPPSEFVNKSQNDTSE